MKGKLGRRARRRANPARLQPPRAGDVPGPSSNPATNLLIADVAVRGASILFRHGVERGLLRTRFDPAKARDIVRGRTMAQTLISFAVARMATRSIPGLLLVSGGLLAKAAFERSQSSRAARRKGDRALEEMADNAPDG